VGSVGSLCTVEGGPPSTSWLVDCHLAEELGFQLLNRREGTSGREAQCEAMGFCALWGSRPSGSACRIAGFSFPPFSGESVILAV
jgi:hypothetical protein